MIAELGRRKGELVCGKENTGRQTLAQLYEISNNLYERYQVDLAVLRRRKGRVLSPENDLEVLLF